MPPPFRLALLQLAVSSADWTVSASVLWVLLPREAGVGFLHFLAAFLLAQILGLMSQIPGGFGVFETVVIALLPAGVDASTLLGPLVAYRVIYYLFPLVVAVGVLLAYELGQRSQQVTTASRAIGTALSLVAPHLSSYTYRGETVPGFRPGRPRAVNVRPTGASRPPMTSSGRAPSCRTAPTPRPISPCSGTSASFFLPVVGR